MIKVVKTTKKVIVGLIIVLLVLGSFTLNWAKNYYGNIGFAEIVFTLNMPLKGASDELVFGFVGHALIQTILVSAVLLFFVFYKFRQKYSLEIIFRNKVAVIPVFPLCVKRKGLFGGIVLGIWAVMLLVSANQSFGLFEFAKSQILQSSFIKETYVNPGDVEITFPEEKRNLIYIWVESLETTAQDIENGGMFGVNYIPEMTQLAKENVSFSHSERLEGAVVAPECGWTMAGLVAETAGIPLKLYAKEQHVDNSMNKYVSFLPGAVALGDILREEGYTNYFMQGSAIRFGGKENYFLQHGDYEIWDYTTAKEKGKIPDDYFVWWGYEDKKLFEYAKEQLLEISAKEGPFNFSMLTVDTHHPNGYICELCGADYEEQYANVYSCASRQVYDFVRWIQEQEFYENTTIVIVGDHCSMNAGFFDGSEEEKYEGSTVRKVYNTIINSAVEPIAEQNRKFTTMDFYPTTLASLGAKIEGERLALGTNLFSDKQTLAEEFGYDYIFEELGKKSGFYDKELLYP